MNLNNLKLIVKKIESKKIKFCVGLNRRFANPYLKMKKLIKKRKINTIKIISRSENANVKQSVRNGGLFMDKGIHFFEEVFLEKEDFKYCKTFKHKRIFKK